MKLKDLFTIDERPRKGLLALEWVILVYAAVTLLVVLFCFTKIDNPQAMIWGRVRVAAITMGLWAVYRFMPCKMTSFLRVTIQMSLLAWWYQDTCDINSLFPNLDHVFAAWDQEIFGFQPALVFAERCAQPLLSEFLELSYVSYYPIIMMVSFFYFFARNKEFEKCCFIILATFFTYFLIFDFIPVAGPMYYYPAIGMENVVKGVFPVLGDKMAGQWHIMRPPGWTDGLGYQFIADVHENERPTGAFPSSHIGVAVVCFLLALRTRNKALVLTLLPLCVGIFFATVYIRAHYAVDAFAGLITGILFYALWAGIAKWKAV